MKPNPLIISWQGRQLRVRHDDPTLKPYSPQASRLRSAVELASDVEGLRLALVSVLSDRYRARVQEWGSNCLYEDRQGGSRDLDGRTRLMSLSASSREDQADG